jgi:hypothetical protein
MSLPNEESHETRRVFVSDEENLSRRAIHQTILFASASAMRRQI